mgnify:CR=1 FL=1
MKQPFKVNNSMKMGGYFHLHPSTTPDVSLKQTGRGTPGGEYLRRFWHPICYSHELDKKLPLRIRALGENLVAFRTGEGEVGALFMNCCHRNTSLEFGIVEPRGLRCCYHGRLFAVDGAMLEMPGEPRDFFEKNKVTQGAYPAIEHAGVVFIYMGPPDQKPIFPVWDRFAVPGLKIVPGDRWPLACNWTQIRENTVDPAHTATLHAIPQYRGQTQFADEFGNFPLFMNWFESPGGIMYMVVRQVDDHIWVRTSECLGPTMSGITSIFEDGRSPKRTAQPFLTFYMLPVDDESSIRFYVNHIAPDEPIPFKKRRELQNFAQSNDRPYEERQYIPGDCEALEGQGAVADYNHEHLGHNDRGVLMFRAYIKQGIEAVAAGKTPHGVYFSEDEVPPTLANDFVMAIKDLEGDHRDPAVLRKLTEDLFVDFVRNPPLNDLMDKNPGA